MTIDPAIPSRPMPPPSEVQNWFDSALDGVRLILNYDDIARSFQLDMNRAHNEDIAAKADAKGVDVAIGEFRDVDMNWLEAWKMSKFYDAVKHVLYEADKVEAFYGGYAWPTSIEEENVTIEYVREIFGRIGIFSSKRLSLAKTMSGRPEEPWHAVGRKVAVTIQSALRSAGYRTRISKTNPESVTVQVGAAFIRWAFECDLEPEGFATAMRGRSRSRTQQSGVSELARYLAHIRLEPN